ncbi:7749_t:CDS:2, partial [Cetraspora pellucida]
MSTTSTSAPSTPINNIKNLAYNILKTFKDGIIKAFTTLSCGHVFHRLCIEKKLLLTIPNTCSFSGCSEEVEIIEMGHRRGSKSSTSSVVRRMEKHSIQSQDLPEIIEEDMSDVDDNEDGESNRPTDQSIIPLEKESRKRPSKDTPENKLSSKK